MAEGTLEAWRRLARLTARLGSDCATITHSAHRHGATRCLFCFFVTVSFRCYYLPEYVIEKLQGASHE
jgi:hypothetical protein